MVAPPPPLYFICLNIFYSLDQYCRSESKIIVYDATDKLLLLPHCCVCVWGGGGGGGRTLFGGILAEASALTKQFQDHE